MPCSPRAVAAFPLKIWREHNLLEGFSASASFGLKLPRMIHINLASLGKQGKKKPGCGVKAARCASSIPAGFAKPSLVVCNPTLRLAHLGGYKPSLGLAQLLGLPAPEVMESSVCAADLHRWLRQSPALL